MINSNNKILNEEEQIFEEYLRKMFEKSEKNLNEIVKLIEDLENKNIYSNFSYFHIQNLKTNLIEIELNNYRQLKLIFNEIKEETNEMSIKFNLLIEKEKILLINNKLNEYFEIIIEHIQLKEMFNSLNIFDRIESIISLFTGIGVLGIVPLENPFILTNRASEIMFKDKLKDVSCRLHFLLEFIRKNQIQQMENLHKYFQDFQKMISL